MTFHLEPITSVSPDLPAPSYETVPCPRLRNGKTCNEPLHFETDGLGRLVELCPVCDWGWRPSREYPLYQQRRAAIVTPPDPTQGGGVKLYSPSRCEQCTVMYTPRTSRQRFCSDACKDAAKKAHHEASRERMVAAPHCECGALLTRSKERWFCAKCRRAERKENRRAFWQNKQLRGAA